MSTPEPSPLLRATTHDGAVAEGGDPRAAHFGDPAAELRHALHAAALVDRSYLGRVLAGGPDALDLLHRLSTNAVRELAPGEGTQTVLTSPKGRIVERLFLSHLGDPGVLLVCGPDAARTTAHLDRYTFAERTGLSEVTSSTLQLALIGPRAREALAAARLPAPDGLGAIRAALGRRAVHVAGGDGVSTEGVSVFVPAPAAGAAWRALSAAAREVGGGPAGTRAAEAWRVLRGVPGPGSELNERHNPLEAGLWDAVRFDKGCYVGQEVVARLNTYDKVARAIRGLSFPSGTAPAAAGTTLHAGSREAGQVTSVLRPPGRRRAVALAYVRRDFVTAGTTLAVGDPDGPPATVHDLPFGETD